ncbi:MAG: START domain-containing protein [Aureispira sp.]|nr:START domain-containing protein [Aureispira sp.]
MLTYFLGVPKRHWAVLLCVLGTLAMCEETTAQSWKLNKSSNGVDVFTRSKEGWGIKEFKAVVKIRASIDQVLATMKDAENRSKWMHNTEDTKDLKVASPNKIYTYSRLDAPWPVSDRDNITVFTIKRPAANLAVIEMTNEADFIPEKSGIVRVKRMEGEWRFKDLGNGYVEVEQQAVGDPGGSLPDWLANSAIVDSPYNTMLNLKYFVESKNVHLSNWKK